MSSTEADEADPSPPTSHVASWFNLAEGCKDGGESHTTDFIDNGNYDETYDIDENYNDENNNDNQVDVENYND